MAEIGRMQGVDHTDFFSWNNSALKGTSLLDLKKGIPKVDIKQPSGRLVAVSFSSLGEHLDLQAGMLGLAGQLEQIGDAAYEDLLRADPTLSKPEMDLILGAMMEEARANMDGKGDMHVTYEKSVN